ncbi:hypothetical protein L1987_54388 [Smallanthus sonchifolius]|uniref:Uncharacterized protein n=1 Tax=Smallanthus sonchifolius TaxID=185202 RepID=A0ACB9E831_9ASTR|nr:hypothetical protein L1987_54388 [Smallanthus sonchifolius]
MELGEEFIPENDGGKHLVLVIKHHFNPSKDAVLEVKPLQSYYPFARWSYNAEKNEFTITNVKGHQMRCSSKAIFKMPSKDIKTLSELPLDNPSKDPRGLLLTKTAADTLSAAEDQTDYPCEAPLTPFCKSNCHTPSRRNLTGATNKAQ